MSEIPLPMRNQEDTQHHVYKAGADAESTEGDQDTEGHTFKIGADAESAEGAEDVEGHVQPMRDVLRRRPTS